MQVFIGIAIIAVVVVCAPCDCAVDNHKPGESAKPVGPLNGTNSECTCGVFATNEAIGKPLIVKSPDFPMDCKKDGAEQCKKMCVALAEASKPDAPKMFCEAVKEQKEPIKPVVHFIACGASSFAPTGLTAQNAICCAAGKPIPCPKVAKRDTEPVKPEEPKPEEPKPEGAVKPVEEPKPEEPKPEGAVKPVEEPKPEGEGKPVEEPKPEGDVKPVEEKPEEKPAGQKRAY